MENANGKDQEHEVLQSVIIGLKECEGRGGGLKREWGPNNFLPRALQSGFLFESWVGRGNTTAKNRVRSSLILRTYLKCECRLFERKGKQDSHEGLEKGTRQTKDTDARISSNHLPCF